MNNDEYKSGLHVHLGGLFIVIIIILILFKVDIREKINSPQFQKNVTYVEDFFVNFYKKNIKGFLQNSVKDISNKIVNIGIEGVQDTVNKKLDGMKKE